MANFWELLPSRLTLWSLCIKYICNLSYFPFFCFEGRIWVMILGIAYLLLLNMLTCMKHVFLHEYLCAQLFEATVKFT